MSQSMSATTSILRISIAANSRSSAVASRVTFLACSNSFSTTSQQLGKSKPPSLDKIRSIGLGYIISTDAAPTVHEMLSARAANIIREGEGRTGVNHRRTQFNVPLTYLPTIKSWAESAKSSQAPFEIDISNPDSVIVKKKVKKSSYGGGDQLIIHAESPTLAALGDMLYAKLRPELPETVIKSQDPNDRSKKIFKTDKSLHDLRKIVSQESRWALHALLMSDKPRRKQLQGEPVEGEEATTLKERLSKKQALEVLKAKIQPKITQEKISVTGLYIQTFDMGDKTIEEFMFEGPAA